MKEYTVNFTLTLIAPFITKGTGAMRFGLDTFAQSKDGKLLINGTLLKGNFRHKLEEWLELNQNKTLESLLEGGFGQKNGEVTYQQNDNSAFSGGNLVFPWHLTEYSVDLPTPEKEDTPDKHSHKHYRIAIEPDTGTVKKGHFQVIDTKYPPNTRVVFKGTGYFKESNTLRKDEVEVWLNKAAQDIRALGAFKTVGFGQIDAIQIEFSDAQTRNSPLTYVKPLLSQQALTITLCADRPLCFAEPRSKTNNTFTSTDYIPGNVLKACIASSAYYRNLASDHPLKRHFDDLVVQHAYPIELSKGSQSNNVQNPPARPRALPLSLQQFKTAQGEIFINASTCETPHVIRKDGDIIAGAFPTDYKVDWSKHKQLIHDFSAERHCPSRFLSVHTAVNADTLSAKNSQLHAIEVIDNDNTEWLTAISLPVNGIATENEQERIDRENEQERIATQLQTLFNLGLFHVGKTKAKVSATSFSVTDLPQLNEDELTADGLFVMKLESDALLFTLDQVSQGLFQQRDPLQPLLEAYFQRVFTSDDGELLAKMAAFHAETKMVGGDYLYHRFGEPKNKGYSYQILVAQGSTFAFSVTTTDFLKLQCCISNFCHTGLPAASEELTWKSTPYLPQNGFAEISVMTSKQARYNQDSACLKNTGYRFESVNSTEIA